MRLIVTGGAGFIGSAVIRQLIAESSHQVLCVDKLTYAGNLESLADAASSARYQFRQHDICQREAIQAAFTEFQPDAIMHLAAESHVDRSIDGPGDFIQTNIIGTYTLLEVTRSYLQTLSADRRAAFRFHHISTDEVYGSLGPEGFFVEETPYDPSSPYSASKAASDHLVRAWGRTYGVPVLVTNCSNNYGPYQFPEKLIPLMIQHGLQGKRLPVYGAGANIRDWLHVDDHARALRLVVERGTPGATYNIGGWNEKTNLQVVHELCAILDELQPQSPHRPHTSLIEFVKDRPGHDHRYAIDAHFIHRELGWKPHETFDTGLRKTVEWYLANQGWVDRALASKYQGERLGLRT